MKNLIRRSRSHVILVLCMLSLSGLCTGEADSGDDGAPMEKAEQAALYSAIQGFVGNLWNGSDLYPDPCGWTPIQGISCDIFDGFWYVTSLSIGPIHDNSLSCAPNVEFRPQLFELKHLRSLSFYNCFFSPHQHPVTLPSTDWSKLADNLESLEFRSNPGLIGQVPISFGSLINLHSLVLLENGLTGEIPGNIGQLTSLKSLVLAGNWFNGRIPDSFGQLNDLLILDLSRNLLSGLLPLTIEGLTSLLKLDLSNNQLEGQLPNGIGYLKNLTLLDIRNNKFSGGLTKSLQDMYSLEEMVLSGNSIGGDLKSIEWHKLQSLVILDLSNMGLFGEIPMSFVQLKRLRFLGLSDNNLTGSLSPKLASLPCVGALYVGGNNLTGELKFSQEFYRKMGRRFGARSNPNLCCPGWLMSTSDAPYGVKPCKQEVTLIEPNLNSKLGDSNLNQNSHFITSLGFSSFAVDGFWWVSLVQLLMMNFLLL
ncbi:piriformospora indica-insensitive protein 2-like [Tripterygium wilfordii]|uniref:Piriformospora indica-insensitive protein 2-like n=1 Tax=Tripterygium wilfordii TaxID=458696 RepID=A0A7J7DG37_TRIWF|nr:piriformospora indica-insensitive protein 2-like [Tripterygium wilfordii]KAF5745302.1 piriformospora indica-insensitive protein 2-like [Tripterygium wilfordii]